MEDRHMAFEIGQRVTSKFFGTGTVKSEMFRSIDDDDPKHPIMYQQVKFDKSGVTTAVMVAKLYPLDEPVRVTKSASQLDYEAACREGLTHFKTVKDFNRNEPRLD